MTPKVRQESLAEINDRAKGNYILLFSMSAGKSGISIKTAKAMIMLEPHWNPFDEAQVCKFRCKKNDIGDQMLDRIHRFDSYHEDVEYYFLQPKDTFEERVFSSQKKKTEEAELILAGTNELKEMQLQSSQQVMSSIFEYFQDIFQQQQRS